MPSETRLHLAGGRLTNHPAPAKAGTAIAKMTSFFLTRQMLPNLKQCIPLVAEDKRGFAGTALIGHGRDALQLN